ncbi:hypothetical protein [Saccharothrix sp. NRRL B-16348]|uniref:hypothetical protein n=1 Tax=Saccharothrix sp. NRRL B-16348 TaxID=1415542 RepID=UPI0012F9C1F1|nr:hypothetical protein [Saccharothrix sp. NRRL B-16348]
MKNLLVKTSRILFSTLILIFPEFQTASDSAQDVKFHEVAWDNGPLAPYIQKYRADNTQFSAESNIAAILFDDGQNDPFVIAVASANRNSSVAWFMRFEGKWEYSEASGQYEFIGSIQKIPMKSFTGRPDFSIANKHSEELLDAYIESHDMEGWARIGRSEREPCSEDVNSCKLRVSKMAGLTDFYYNIPYDTAEDRAKAVERLAPYINDWVIEGRRIALVGNRLFDLGRSPNGQPKKKGGSATQPATPHWQETLPFDLPGPDSAGGVDFSTVELRYISDSTAGEQGIRYSFAATPAPTDRNVTVGANSMRSASDSFFVWLAVPRNKFWVNLNPDEPDRVIDPALATTDAGRVLLASDLQLKKTVAGLLHPDSPSGQKFWSEAEATDGQICLSTRQWIVPGTADVHEADGGLFIIDAPLEVRMESETPATGSLTQGCALNTPAAKQREQIFRDIILPQVEKAVNEAPEYAELRGVYLSRVAAEWYRNQSAARKTTYSEVIDSGDVASWPARTPWSPRAYFDEYVTSYQKGEFSVERRQDTAGGVLVRTYTYGGVDFSQVRLNSIDDGRTQEVWPGGKSSAIASFDHRASDANGRTWLGSAGHEDDSNSIVTSSEAPENSSAGARETDSRLQGIIVATAAGVAFLLVVFRVRHVVRRKRRTRQSGS